MATNINDSVRDVMQTVNAIYLYYRVCQLICSLCDLFE